VQANTANRASADTRSSDGGTHSGPDALAKTAAAAAAAVDRETAGALRDQQAFVLTQASHI